MKITLVISSLACGGAERVMSIIANYWVDKNHDITLITMDSADADFFPINPSVKRIGLGLSKKSKTIFSALKNNYVRLRHLRRAIKESRPDVVISFIDRMNIMTLLASRGLSVPIIVSEHIDPRQISPGVTWALLRRLSYYWSEYVVVLTEELREVFSEFTPFRKLRVIPNPAISQPESVTDILPLELQRPYIVAMGRLVSQKGFDYLMEAFSGCRRDMWSLVILGEGPEREHLENLREHLGLIDRVYLPGRIGNPHAIMRKAEIFVLSSRFEGFPMALLEAMSFGLPVVSFDCPTGPAEMIIDGKNGVLVEPQNVQLLTKALSRLMDNEDERLRLGKAARDVVHKYSIHSIMRKWESLLYEIQTNAK